jgi:hypothetical protein
MTNRPRVQVWSNCRFVTLQGVLVPAPQGDPELLFGVADDVGMRSPVACVRFDDGRELLVLRKDLEEEAPDTEREVAA